MTMLELAALIIKTHATKGSPVAVIGSEKMGKFLQEVCDADNIPRASYMYDHYYNITSKNAMQRCDTIITLSTPQPPAIQLEASVKLSGWPREAWERHYVDNEMIQAIARARPSLETRPSEWGMTSVPRSPVHIYIFGSRGIFTGGREKELVKEQYQEMTPAQLEGKLKYGGDGSIPWTRSQLRSVSSILSCFGNAPLTQKEIQAMTKLAWSPVKNVTNHLLKLGILSREKNKLIKVKK
jgi:hypothetical protein